VGRGRGGGYGSAAFGSADLAVGLLVLARAGAVARTDPAHASCIRCCVWALFAVFAVCIVGGVAGYMAPRRCAPWGSTVAAVCLSL
jgi:hypothetical protein